MVTKTELIWRRFMVEIIAGELILGLLIIWFVMM